MTTRFLFPAMAMVALLLTMPTQAAADDAASGPAHRLQTVLDDLTVMEALLSSNVNDATRSELLEKLRRSRKIVRSVQQDMLRPGEGAAVTVVGSEGSLSLVVEVDGDRPRPMVEVVEVVEVMEPQVFPMPPPAFGTLRQAIEDESFDDEKLALLRDAARHNVFFVDQAIQLIELFTFSDGKVDAGVILYPQVIDIENWYRVYGAYTFDSDKEALRRKLGL
jgi:Domain of unknown function (DUF4476)